MSDARKFAQDTQALVILEDDAPILPDEINEACATCKHWRRLNARASFGECGATRAYSPAPVVTTDRTSCSNWSLA